MQRVGARVRVCHSDGYWYYGTLASKEEKKGKFRVAFDDGDGAAEALITAKLEALGGLERYQQASVEGE